MGGDFSYKEQWVHVSNRWVSTTLDFAIEVAEKTARTDQERAWAETFKNNVIAKHWPGRDYDIEKEFPTIAERKFWARVFFDVMQAIYNREIGNTEVTCWQQTAIHIAYIVARLITKSVRDVEPHWRPEPACRIDEQIFTAGGLNVRL